MEKNLDPTKPRYSDHILPVPWPLVASRFHCIVGGTERVLVTKKVVEGLLTQFLPVLIKAET